MGKIHSKDKDKYSSEDSSKSANNTADASNNTTGSQVESTNINNNILGGNNSEEDYANILKRYISDLYDDLCSGDAILREAGLD
jgi:hypothetical protein